MAEADRAQSQLAKPAIGMLPAVQPAHMTIAPGAGDKNAATSNVVASDVNDNWDGTPFYKGIVVKDGNKLQHWSYRSDHPPLVFLSSDVVKGHQGLIGDLYFPAAAKVSVFFRQVPVYPLSRLEALTGAPIDEVVFGRYALKDIEDMVPTLVKCKSVESIRMGAATWSADDCSKSVDVINQFPNVRRLTLAAKYEASTLAKIRRLQELQELKLNRSQPYLHDCLKLIGGSKDLRSLSVSNWSIPSSDLQLLVQLPNLEKLVIGRLTGSHEQFAVLAKLPHLQILDMAALHYRSDLAGDVSLLKSLKQLRVLMTDDWTNPIIAQFRHDLPNVVVVLYLNGPGGRGGPGGRKANGQSGTAAAPEQSGREAPADPSAAPKSSE
jgi:hypothetical protein